MKKCKLSIVRKLTICNFQVKFSKMPNFKSKNGQIAKIYIFIMKTFSRTICYNFSV